MKKDIIPIDNFVNQMFLGNCLDVMNDIPNESIDLIVTDPPYLINYKTNYRIDKDHDFCSVIKNDDNPQLISDYIKESYRILKNDTAMYMFCGFDHCDFFKQELERFFVIKNMIVWVKNNWTAGDLEAQFGKQYELIFLVNKGRKKFNGERLTDVWYFDRVSGEEQIHQNQKPIKLIKQCIEKHSIYDDIVFDGFAGSGTTLVAAKELNRKYIGVELDERYFEFAVDRIDACKSLTRQVWF